MESELSFEALTPLDCEEEELSYSLLEELSSEELLLLSLLCPVFVSYFFIIFFRAVRRPSGPAVLKLTAARPCAGFLSIT